MCDYNPFTQRQFILEEKLHLAPLIISLHLVLELSVHAEFDSFNQLFLPSEVCLKTISPFHKERLAQHYSFLNYRKLQLYGWC